MPSKLGAAIVNTIDATAMLTSSSARVNPRWWLRYIILFQTRAM